MEKNIAWLGTGTSIAGAFAVAFGYMLPGYSLFLIGSASWLYIGTVSNNNPLITLNAVFFLANTIGFYRAI